MGEERNGRSLDRRGFLEHLSGGVIGAGLGFGLSPESLVAQPGKPKLEKRNEQSGMVYRRFGKTNLNVSRLSYGCIKLQDDRLPVLEMAVERGANLVHISEGYNRGQSIRSLGKFLKAKGNRDKVWIMLKGQHGGGLNDNIDDELKSLNTEVIDPTNVGQFLSTVQKANRENVGIMAMKTVRGGPEETDKIVPTMFAAGVTTILRSLTTRERLDSWIDSVAKAPKEAAGLPADCELNQPGLCALCGQCERCPNGVAIQDIVRDYTYYYEQQGLAELAAERCGEIDRRQTALACKDCGRCEKVCPTRVPNPAADPGGSFSTGRDRMNCVGM